MVASVDPGWCMCPFIPNMHGSDISTFNWRVYIPMELSHCSLESGKARQNEWHCIKEMKEGCGKGTDEDDEFRDPGEKRSFGPGNWDYFRDSLQVWHTTDCLQVNDGERTLPPAALNSQNVHPGITNGPQGWILLPFFAAPMNSSHYFLFNPCIILRILVVEVSIVRLSSTFHHL